MRRIILATIEVGKDQMTTRDLLQHMLRADVRFNSNFEGMKSALRIDEACRQDVIILEEAEWKMACDALRSPSPMNNFTPYPTAPAHASMPLVDSVLEAEAFTPEPPEDK